MRRLYVWTNERRNSILMPLYYPELSSASDWLKKKIPSSNQKHYPDLGSYASSVYNSWAHNVPQASFYRETSGGVAKYPFFPQAVSRDTCASSWTASHACEIQRQIRKILIIVFLVIFIFNFVSLFWQLILSHTLLRHMPLSNSRFLHKQNLMKTSVSQSDYRN